MNGSAKIFTLTALACVAFLQVNAHLTIVGLTGETNGFKGTSFGELEGTPRNGTARFPFQADSGIIRQSDIEKGIASVCGRTLMGPIDMKLAFQKAESEGLPDIHPGGRIAITAHQINADGGGPYSCGVDTTATGTKFVPIPIEVNIPGANGRSDAKSIDLPLIARMPANMLCTGGSDGQTCLLRCINGAKAGPFGACLAFTQKPSTAADPTPGNPPPSDVDFFSESLDILRQKAQNEQVVITPIAKKVMPVNLSTDKMRRSLGSSPVYKRQATSTTPQLMVYPSASRVANLTGNTPASTTFGTNLNGTGSRDNNGGNGNKSATPNGKANQQLNRRQTTNKQMTSYVASKSPTTEGIAAEIATGPLGQADVPKNAQPVRDLKVTRRSQRVFKLDD